MNNYEDMPQRPEDPKNAIIRQLAAQLVLGAAEWENGHYSALSAKEARRVAGEAREFLEKEAAHA